MCTFSLRAHHALCIQFFEGKGYSNEFAVHMRKIVDKLNADATVKITAGNDDICSKCPNLVNGICAAQEKVCRYDEKVMKLCGFSTGQELSVKDFLETARQNIIQAGKLSQVCGDCSWKCGQ